MARLSLDFMGPWVPGAWALRRPRSFQTTLVLLILPLILGSGFLRSLIHADFAKRLITRSNDQLLAAMAGELAATLTLALNPALTKAQLNRLASLAPNGDIQAATGQLPALIATLEQAPNLSALFCGIAEPSDASWSRLDRGEPQPASRTPPGPAVASGPRPTAPSRPPAQAPTAGGL